MNRSISALLIAGLVALPVLASAATFSVNPISISLSKSNSSATLAVTNDSRDKLRLQVSGFAWAQKPNGDMQLQKTEDLVFFPSLVTLDAGETRRIRVGSTVAQGPVEKTFRIFMEELPALQSIIGGGIRTPIVQIRMKIGVPVFVSPTVNPVVSGAVRDVAIRGNALSFDVVNTGNMHFSAQRVHVSAPGVLTQDISGWYVLAGGVRHFTLPLPRGGCRRIESVTVNVRADVLSFGAASVQPAKSCS